MTQKKPQIPLTDMLNAIDRNDLGFYDRLDEEQKKAFSAWMAMRYASSGSRNALHYLLMVNGIVNVDFNSLRKHPGLQWRLLAACGVGRSERHPWIAPGKRGKKDPVMEFLQTCYPEMKPDDLKVFRSMLGKEDIQEMAENQGLDRKAVRELVK